MSKRRKDKIERGVLIRGIVICIAVAAISLSLIPGLAAQGTGDTVKVTVNAPAYVEETFNVTIEVDNVTEFNSGQFDLSFNSSVLNVTDVKDGEIDGEVSMPMDVGVNGSGYLAEVEFEVKGKSEDKSNLDISGLLVDTEAKEIDASWYSDEVTVPGTAVTVDAPEYVSGSFNATLRIGNVTDLNSGQFDLSFNSSIVNVTDVKDGEIEGKAVPIFIWNFVDADTVRVLVSMPMEVGVSGSGYLAEVVFGVKGKSGDKSKLDISGLLVDTEANEIDTDWYGDEVTI
jgi:hypothetical protein